MSIPSGFRPLLAVEADLDSVKFPCLVSPKLDGIRVIVVDGVAYSRNLKPIRNKFVQNYFKEHSVATNNLDGEIIVGIPTDKDVFRNTSSGVMAEGGEPNFTFYAFDTINENLKDKKYVDRFDTIDNRWKLDSYLVNNMYELIKFEEQWTSEGYEGLMIRSLDGRYKWGRSSAKEGILLKVKRFLDSEAKIIGFEERLHNANEATEDNLGHTKRSSCKDNMIPMNTLGALVCLTTEGKEFRIGSGFNDSERQIIWNSKEYFLGKLAKYKYTMCGAKDLPRFPVYLGIRDQGDL